MDSGELEEAIFEFSAALKINSAYGRAQKNLDAAKAAMAKSVSTRDIINETNAEAPNLVDEKATESSSTAEDPIPLATGDLEPEYLREKEKGNQAFAKGDMNGAVAAYTKAIQVGFWPHIVLYICDIWPHIVFI
jgi:hypothetical protein